MFNHLFHGVLSTQRMVVKTSVIRGCGGWNASLRVWDDLELGSPSAFPRCGSEKAGTDRSGDHNEPWRFYHRHGFQPQGGPVGSRAGLL